jgi:thiamine-monophosphate kinase
MMDVSDGLSSDLARLCEASRVGARVYETRIPHVEVSEGVAKLLRKKAADLVRMALHGGDDYELLFTIPKRNLRRLSRAPGFKNLTAIGEIRRGSGVSLVGTDGVERPMVALGWDSFRQK